MLIIALDAQWPTIDTYSNPGQVIVRTGEKFFRDWGRLPTEFGEYKYPKSPEDTYDLGSIDVRQHLDDAERWRVQSRDWTFEFYLSSEGVVCSYTESQTSTGWVVHCPVSSFSGVNSSVSTGPERYERV